MNDLQNEVKMLGAMDHPNIVRLFEFYDEKFNFALITEIVPGGEVIDQIKKRGSYKEEEAINLLKTLLQTVSFFHGKGIVHRDLKP